MVPNLRVREAGPRTYDEPVPTGRRLRALLIASHPEPAAAVTLLTTLLAVAAGRGWGVVWLTFAVAAGQLGVGWSNDYLDRGYDRAQQRADKPLAAAAQAPPAGQAPPEPAAVPPLRPGTVRTTALLALGACVLLSLAAGAGFAAAHLTAVAFALAYNLRLKVLPLSVVPYVVAFGLLPVAVTLGLPKPHWPPAWAVAAAALIGAAGHFTQSLPDIPADRRMGIRGLPQVAGQRASGLAAAGLLLAANLTIALAPGSEPGSPPGPWPARILGLAVTAVLAAAVGAAALAGRPRLAFRVTLAAAGVTVLAFLVSGTGL